MDIKQPDLRDRKGFIIQIDRIAHLVNRGKRVTGRDRSCRAFRYRLFDLFPFLVRHGKVDLMGGRFTVPDGNGISLAGYSLAGQIGRGRFLAFQLPHKFCGGGFVIKRPDPVAVPKDIFLVQIVPDRIGAAPRFHVGIMAFHDNVAAFPILSGLRLFLRCDKAIFLDKLCDPALYPGPWQIHTGFGNRKGREVIAVCFSQPCRRILIAGMGSHVISYRLFAGKAAVPLLEGGVNGRLRVGRVCDFRGGKLRSRCLFRRFRNRCLLHGFCGRCFMYRFFRFLRGLPVVFRHGKSRGRFYTLCFVDRADLFLFGREQG